MWFAFKLVSLSHWIQQAVELWNQEMVVICFQISIFEPLNTAYPKKSNKQDVLWFAFKLVSLSHWIQHWQFIDWRSLVVICFQISIFEPLNTAIYRLLGLFYLLWFAFKLVSLSHWIQPVVFTKEGKSCCDLLSN